MNTRPGTRRRYGASEATQDVFAVLIGLALVGALLDSWRVAAVAAGLLVLASFGALLALGLGRAAARPYPERDQ